MRGQTGMIRHSVAVVFALLLVVTIVAFGPSASYLVAAESPQENNPQPCVTCAGGDSPVATTSLSPVSGDDGVAADEANADCTSCDCGGGSDDGLGIGLANPAALYCERLGYEYKTVESEDGQLGVCVLPDGEQVDAWAFYAGESGAEFSYCANMGWAVVVDEGGDGYAEKCTSCVLPVAGSRRKAVSELLSFGELGQHSALPVEAALPDGDDTYGLESVGALPEHFDWRDKDGQDWTTPVKNQGGCGSCWAFSAVGAVEPEYNIAYGNPDLDLDLSEQYLVSSCCSYCGDCGGGWHSTALSFIRDNGITDEACYEYQGTNSACSERCADWSDRLYTIDERGYVPSNKEAIKQYLVDTGPVAVAMGYGGAYGGHWDGDIYRCTRDVGANHAVVIVGYDESDDYWIVRNSWGPGWNGDGHFQVGCGECSIENSVYYTGLTVPEPTPTPTPPPGEVFFDSFEDCLLTNWVQDSQNDWFPSSQRSRNPEDNCSAEVDGSAADAALTLKDPIDLSGMSGATLTFSWFIEGGFDPGEYLALDLWNGATWNEVARIRGEVDEEDVWHDEVIDLSNYLIDGFKLRFRGKASLSLEDANVDMVKIEGSAPPGPTPTPEPTPTP